MSPQLAALICILGIIYLFWVDVKKGDSSSKALWIPFCWMFFAGSRYLSQWLNLGIPVTSSDAYLDGSPLDRAVFLFLIIVGVLILRRRRLNWNEIFTRNTWILFLFLFAGISIIWSDYPFLSFKRWIKAAGNVIMVLVILTEKRPFEAIGLILRRLSFLLLPLSVLFIKYYPDIGRAYHFGKPMFIGVASQKNTLGQIVLFSGIYFCWDLLLKRRKGIDSGQKLHFSIYLIMLPMIAWLFYVVDSATSLFSMVIVVVIFLVSRHPVVAGEPRRIIVIGFISMTIYGILELVFDIKGSVIAMLGRDATLTTRVPMWEGLLDMVENPIIGTGFASFWTGQRQEAALAQWGQGLQAHNGYLEVYLNLGLVGLLLLLFWIISGVRKVAHHLDVNYPVAMLRLCFIVVVAFYNWTEATFYGVSIMWMLLMLGIMDISGQPDSTSFSDHTI